MEQLSNLISQYAKVASSTIGHVLDEGFLPNIHAVNHVDHVVGKVRTVCLNSINAMSLRNALLESQPGDVLVIDARGLKNRACWGEQRHRAAIYHQISAIVVLGAVTDISELKKMNVPVFAKSVSCLTTRLEGECQMEFDAPIDYEGTNIHSGDILIGDEDGVFILKQKLAEQYIEQFLEMENQEVQKRADFFKKYASAQYYR